MTLPADKPEPPVTDWEHLKRYGYAPGGYMIRCWGCKQIMSGVDKRAIRCRPCAEKLHAEKQEGEPVACDNALAEHAIEELRQLGYTIENGALMPPEHLHKLAQAAGHPLAAPPDRPVPVGPIYCVGNKVSHAYFWRRSDADAFAASAGATVGLHVWEVQVMGRPPAESERIAALEAERDDFHMKYRAKCDEETKAQAMRIAALEAALKVAGEALQGWRSVDVHSALTEDEADAIKAKDDAALRAIEGVRRG